LSFAKGTKGGPEDFQTPAHDAAGQKFFHTMLSTGTVCAKMADVIRVNFGKEEER